MKFPVALTNGFGRTILKVKKYSPEILVVVGVAGIVSSTVLACRATLKVEDVLDEHQEKMNKIHLAEATVSEEKYSKEDAQKDKLITYVQTSVEFIKLYGPSVTLGVVSIGCILGSYGIMKKRNVGLLAAYKAIEQSFNTYRGRVIEEYGEQKDEDYRNGVYRHTEEVTVVDPETGKKKKVKQEVKVVDPTKVSQYARIFDDTNKNWSEHHPQFNVAFLNAQQNYANDKLNRDGHLFLNEVYDQLGFSHTPDGAIVGWVKGNGDDFVDFGILDIDNDGFMNDYQTDTIGEQRRDFVNGKRNSVVLDFNVDGIIYNLI